MRVRWIPKGLRQAALLLGPPLLALAMLSPTAQADSFTVTNLNNTGDGSLRAAIAAAARNEGPDTIDFDEGVRGDLVLSETLEFASQDITLVGPGAETLSLIGNRGVHVITVASDARLTVSDLSISNGNRGISNAGSLNVSDCQFTYNNYGLYNNGILDVSNSHFKLNSTGLVTTGNGIASIENSQFIENDRDGIVSSTRITINGSLLSNNGESGLENSGTASINESQIVGNSTMGIYNSRGTLRVEQSLIRNNFTTSSNAGAGIYFYGSSLSLYSSTLADNQATNGCGGGLNLRGGSQANIVNSTFTNNLANTGGGLCTSINTTLTNVTLVNNESVEQGGGVFVAAGTFVMGNSLIGGNRAPEPGEDDVGNPLDFGIEIYVDENGRISSRGSNLIGQNAKANVFGDDLSSGDSILEGAIGTAIDTHLADNGGPTPTLLLTSNSPAINAGDNGQIPFDVDTDQRGLPRIQNGTVDIGAIEVGNATPGEQYDLAVGKSGNGRITSTPSGIDCGESCSASFDSGSEITLTAIPATDYSVGSWSGGSCTGTGTTCTLTLTQNTNVSVQFVTSTSGYSLSVSKSGSGTVTSDPAGIDCGATCSTTFAADTQVTLTATPASGASFSSWGGACSGSTPTCTLTMSAARNVLANFSNTTDPGDSPILEVTANGPGSVSSSPSGILCGQMCSAEFDLGTTVTLTARANVGSNFTGWSGACSGTATTCTLSLDQSRSVQANFSSDTAADYSVAVSVIGEGQVTSTPAGIACDSLCIGSFTDGTALSLLATPADGWIFTGWEGACAEADTTTTCSLTLEKSEALSAVFEKAEVAGEQSLDVVVVGTGSVASTPSGIDCGTDCSQSYADNTLVTLTATPNGDTQFIGWGGACVDSGVNATCQLTMSEAHLAVAAFGGVIINRESTAWKVTEIYMATLGYAPDDDGLQYWVNNIDLLAQWTPDTVAQSFFDQPLVQQEYPEEAGYERFIDALYRNIFGHGADSQGFDYWLSELEQGHVARNQMIIAMINGGWANPSPDAQSDMVRFGNRIQVALDFAEYQSEHGISYGQLSTDDQAYLRQVGRSILLNVTTDDATRETAIADIPTLLSPLID